MHIGGRKALPLRTAHYFHLYFPCIPASRQASESRRGWLQKGQEGIYVSAALPTLSLQQDCAATPSPLMASVVAAKRGLGSCCNHILVARPYPEAWTGSWNFPSGAEHGAGSSACWVTPRAIFLFFLWLNQAIRDALAGQLGSCPRNLIHASRWGAFLALRLEFLLSREQAERMQYELQPCISVM